MFREMRRKDRQLTAAEAAEILKNANFGILSVLGDQGYPYGVPVNYAWSAGRILFHSTAGDSHKLDALRREPKVCFTVVSRSHLLTAEMTTDFESAVVFGTARILEDSREKASAMGEMMAVLAPEAGYDPARGCGTDAYVMVEITPVQITGKMRR